jgi:hypothetical protein
MPAIQGVGQDTSVCHQNSSSPVANVTTSGCISGDFQPPVVDFLHHFCKNNGFNVIPCQFSLKDIISTYIYSTETMK